MDNIDRERFVRAETALRECVRRVMAWKAQHSDDACAVMGLADKMVREVILPVLEGNAKR